MKVLKKLREKLLGRKAHIVHHDLKNFSFELFSKEEAERFFPSSNNILYTDREAIYESLKNHDKADYAKLDDKLKFSWCKYWCDHSRKDLKIVTSDNFILLSYDNDRRNKILLEFAEKACDTIYENLGDVLQGIPGRILVLHLNRDDYYELEASYGFVTEAVMSGGMFVRNIIPYLVFHSERDFNLPDIVLAHELTHALFCFNELPLWLDEALACTMEKTITQECYYDFSLENGLKNMAYWNEETIQQFWTGESFTINDSQDFSYMLAQSLLNVIIQNYKKTFKEFLKNAKRIDGGESAAQQYLGVSLGEIAALYLGEGSWQLDEVSIKAYFEEDEAVVEALEETN